MLARRRRKESEDETAIKNGTYEKKDIYADRPMLKELITDIAYKRRRTDANNELIVSKKFTAYDYDRVNHEKDELNKQTPMWYALQHQNNCQSTIKVQHSTMFWLGYFIRRIMHEDNLDKLKHINRDQLHSWESNNEIKNYFTNQAKKVKLAHTKTSSQSQDKSKAESDMLKREIQHYLQTTQHSTSAQLSRIEIREVNELWEGKSPYHFDKEQKHEYARQDKDCDQHITNVMHQRSRQLWDELQFYWFQVNKNLHPRYRKEQVMASTGSSDPHSRMQYPGGQTPGDPQSMQHQGMLNQRGMPGQTSGGHQNAVFGPNNNMILAQ